MSEQQWTDGWIFCCTHQLATTRYSLVRSLIKPIRLTAEEDGGRHNTCKEWCTLHKNCSNGGWPVIVLVRGWWLLIYNEVMPLHVGKTLNYINGISDWQTRGSLRTKSAQYLITVTVWLTLKLISSWVAAYQLLKLCLLVQRFFSFAIHHHSKTGRHFLN